MVNKRGNRVMVNLAISPVDQEDEGDAARVVTSSEMNSLIGRAPPNST